MLAILISTVPGERQLVPLFGVNDPSYARIEEHDVSSKLSLFGPPVKITRLATEQTSDVLQTVVVEFTSSEDF
jgi:hypothetical protein